MGAFLCSPERGASHALDTSSSASDAAEGGFSSDDDGKTKVVLLEGVMRLTQGLSFSAATDYRVFALHADKMPAGELLVLVAPTSTEAGSLLGSIAAMLDAQKEQLAIEGSYLTLTSGMPHRTLAEAGVGAPLPAGWLSWPPSPIVAPRHRLVIVQWCGICLCCPSSAKYCCRGMPPHCFCRDCASRYVSSTAMGHHSVRCPMPGCACTLVCDSLESVLAKAKDMRAKRVTDQEARLRKARAGEEGVEMQRLVRMGRAMVRPCPSCSVLVFKEGGCSNVSVREYSLRCRTVPLRLAEL